MSSEIQLSKYQDAEIIGLKCLDLENGLELSFRLANDVESTILLSGCQFYRIDGMWKQNVVYRIRNTLTESIDHNDIMKLLHVMVRNDSQKPSLPISQIELWLASVIDGNLILSVVEPSTSAEIIMISKSMSEVLSRD